MFAQSSNGNKCSKMPQTQYPIFPAHRRGQSWPFKAEKKKSSFGWANALFQLEWTFMRLPRVLGPPLETAPDMCYIFQVTDGISCLFKPCATTRLHGSIGLSGRVAQLAEHSALNRQVVGSIPTASTITSIK